MARRMFKRRRKPVEWVRTSNSGSLQAEPKYKQSLFYDGTTAQVIDVQNLIIGDAPFVTDSLIEERKTYVIDRIVGRMQFAIGGGGGVGPSAIDTPGPLRVAFGLFVGEVDQNGNILDLDRWDLFTTYGEEVDWIFRDTINLAPGPYYANRPYPTCTRFNWPGWQFYPTNEYDFPTGIVDTRAKRRVGQEERLFLQTAIVSNDNAWDYGAGPATLDVWTDLRCLLHWSAGTNKR